jgi:hypothetical protein
MHAGVMPDDVCGSLLPLPVLNTLCLSTLYACQSPCLSCAHCFNAGKKFDVLGFTRPKTTSSKPDEPEQLPGFGVFAPWLGGLAGWLAGGWWFEQREMTQVELMDMKSRELRNGRLAM